MVFVYDELLLVEIERMEKLVKVDERLFMNLVFEGIEFMIEIFKIVLIKVIFFLMS